MEFLNPVKGVGHPFQSILGLQPEELQNPTETQFIQNAIGKVTSFSGPSYFEYTVPDAVGRPGAVMVVRTSTPWVYLVAPMNAGGDQTTNQINGSGWIDLAPYESFAFISDGSNWFTIFDSRPKAHLPASGSDGQMLRKHTSNPYQSYWADPPREGDMLRLIENEVSVSFNAVLGSSALGKMHVLSSSSAQTITLPTAVGSARSVIGFRVLGTGFKTIQPSGSQTIDGQTSKVMTQRESVALISDGNNWHTVHEGYSRAHMPPGGAAGQVLAKTSQADFEAGWVTPSGGGGGALKHYFSVFQSTAQSIPHQTFTKVSFETKLRDPSSAFSTSTHLFTAPEGGYYTFEAVVYVFMVATGFRMFVRLVTTKETKFLAALHSAATITSGGLANGGAYTTYMDAGDTAFVEVFQDTGVARNTSASNQATWFSGRYVGVGP